MSTTKELQMEIAASLWIKPATLEELCKRDFLSGMAIYGVNTLVNIAISKGLIYEKSGILKCYKATVYTLNEMGYDLYTGDVIQSEFEKAYRNNHLI